MKFLIIFLTILFHFNTLYSENWFTSAGNYNASKYSSLNQINQENVNQLEKTWVYNNGFKPNKEKNNYSNNQATPIFTGKNLIVSSLDNSLIALNPETGKEKWKGIQQANTI